MCRSSEDQLENLAISQCWRPRSLYAAVFTWISIAGGRFLAPFLEHEGGLTASQIGFVFALQQVITVLMSPVAGVLADAYEQRLQAKNATGHTRGSGRVQVLVWGIIGGTVVVLLHGVRYCLPHVEFFQSVSWYAILRIFFSVSNAFTFPVLDGICLDYLQRVSSMQDYGQERLYGAISWAITHFLFGVFLDFFGYVASYPLTLAATGAFVMTVFFYNKASENKTMDQARIMKRHSDIIQEDDKMMEDNDYSSAEIENAKPVVDSPNGEGSFLLSIAKILFLSCFGVAFVIALVSLSAGQAVVESLVFLFFETLGSSNLMMGVTVVLTVAFEIPIFHVAPKLLERFGAVGLLLIATTSYTTRVLGYTFIPDGKTFLVLGLEPLHGVTYACRSTSGVDFMSSLSPPGFESSGQGLLQMLTGIGSVAGLSGGGYLEETYGARTMYRVAALVACLGCLPLVIATVLGVNSSLELQRGNHSMLPQEERGTGERCHGTLELVRADAESSQSHQSG